MAVFRSVALLVWPLGLLVLRLLPSHGEGGGFMLPEEACADFAPGSHPGASWTLDACLDVWSIFAKSAPPGLQGRSSDVDIWKEAADELRRVGSPCLVASTPSSDGAGSSTIRHMATWILADEMGCDWVTPDWGKRHVKGGNGTVIYCHRATTGDEKAQHLTGVQTQRCSIVDWLAYFQFGIPSVDLAEDRKVKILKAGRGYMAGIRNVKTELESTGFANMPYDNVVFEIEPSFASRHLMSIGSWDEAKRNSARKVLQAARENFHRHPRPWYDENPKCEFDATSLNVAIHVRMGDRRAYVDATAEYFRLLEAIMATVSQQVVEKGLEQPRFHVFSETLVPCPSVETGTFDEFPAWPVQPDQVRACLDAKTPDDCPGLKAGSSCKPNRSGNFNVVGMPVVLHVGPDVQNAMTCMIQADAVMMGCSTFGQVAGLLTKGISLFSTGCAGNRTPYQYRTIPPLAVAERGYLWVPITGSWRDPVLESTDIMSDAFDDLIATKRIQP